MTREIDVATLQEWLQRREPVTILDVRPAPDREQWWIPGSRHVAAYESLKAGSPGPLAGLPLPEGAPVVAVCGSGRVSLTAAELLVQQRSIPAFSLRGGMKAWSLAWNTASRSFLDLQVTQIRRTGKGCLSYLIASRGETAVIDASLDPPVYLSLAQSAGVRLRYALDTHIHADHLSRTRRLAEQSGAELILPRQDRVRYPHRAVSEGDRLPLGGASLEVLATPGHTTESVTYLLRGVGVFTGDTLFLAGVGRPDLHAARPEDSETRARRLFHSLQRLAALDAELLVFPGHTPEPVAFDGVLLAAPLGEVVRGLADWLAAESAFVRRILPGIPPTPPNYAEITRINEAGEWLDCDPAELEAGANRCAVSS
jgi:glyoxylase-like metal-dependent hydrolase (beta-lactamase superfamily II)/rhodanese-related sulfurtransferase